MHLNSKSIAILGSTGSIGCSTLDVIRQDERLNLFGITANRSLDKLEQQAVEFKPPWVIAADDAAARNFQWEKLPRDSQLRYGQDALVELVTQPEVDVVVSAIVGSAGMSGTWAAIEAGKTVALANKETMVIAGPLITRLAVERESTILPVDSEHSAIFQAMQSGSREEVKRVILTASGGPFRKHSLDELNSVTLEDALAHPTWDMGTKITIDSATMMNKALEIVEARWLFDLSADQIDVVVHPQSVVHSLVEFKDGSVMAQLSPPDMRLPIQYALSYPERREGVAKKLDLSQAFQLEFEPPDIDRFPALRLGFEVARSGGTCGAVLNAANEEAVTRFVDGELRFVDIPRVCESVLQNHQFDPNPTLDELRTIEKWAREEVKRWTAS